VQVHLLALAGTSIALAPGSSHRNHHAQCLPQVRGGRAGVAVLHVGLAESFQGAQARWFAANWSSYPLAIRVRRMRGRSAYREPGPVSLGVQGTACEGAAAHRAVVAGHKRDGDADSPDYIGRTRRYIEDFTAAAEKASSFTDLYEAMIALYPDRVNRAVPWHSAKAFLA
jgi:hypothetical protein